MYVSIICATSAQRLEMFAWCRQSLGRWVAENGEYLGDWQYTASVVDHKYVSEFEFRTAAHKTLFDIRWSHLKIFDSPAACLRYLQKDARHVL